MARPKDPRPDMLRSDALRSDIPFHDDVNITVSLVDFQTYVAQKKTECLKPDALSEQIHFTAEKLLGKGTYGEVYIGCRVQGGEKDCMYAIKYTKLEKRKIPSYRLELSIMDHLSRYGLTLKIQASWMCKVKHENGKETHYGIIIMDRGIPFTTYFAKKSPTDDQLFRFFDRVERMHDHKIMHLDLSKDNIIVFDDEIYPIDFGLSVYTARPLPTILRLCDFTHLIRGDYMRSGDGKTWGPGRHIRNVPDLEPLFLSYYARRTHINENERQYMSELWELACMQYSIDIAYSQEEIVASRAPRQAGVMYSGIIALLTPDIVFHVGLSTMWSRLSLYSQDDQLNKTIDDDNLYKLKVLYKAGQKQAKRKKA